MSFLSCVISKKIIFSLSGENAIRDATAAYLNCVLSNGLADSKGQLLHSTMTNSVYPMNSVNKPKHSISLPRWRCTTVKLSPFKTKKQQVIFSTQYISTGFQKLSRFIAMTVTYTKSVLLLEPGRWWFQLFTRRCIAQSNKGNIDLILREWYYIVPKPLL